MKTRAYFQLWRCAILGIVVLGLLVFVLPSGITSAAGNGSISGQVLNKTAGGSNLGNLDVTLTALVNDNISGTQKTTADASGKFSFNGLTIDATYSYTVTTTYLATKYTSDKISLTAEKPSQTVELDVYDTTTSDAAIQVTTGHIVIYTTPGALQVLEVWDFNNTGDKTYIGMAGKTGHQTLKFTLPAGASQVTPGEGFVPETTDAGIVDTMPVPPGVVNDSFSYVIPYQGSTATIIRKLDYAVTNFAVLVQDTGVTVKSSSLIQTTPLSMAGTTFQYLTATNLPKGFDADLSLTGIGRSAPSSTNSNKTNPSVLWPWLVAGILVVLLIGVLVYPRLKKQLAQPESTAIKTGETPADEENPSEEELVAELAQLEKEYKSGKLTRQYYQNRKNEIKALLQKVWKEN